MGNDNITITLRPFNVSDAEDFWLLANSDDSVIRSFNLESRYVNVIITFDEWPGFKAKLWGHPGFKAICLNNKPIGYSSGCRATLGCAVHRSYWGKGINKGCENGV